VRKALSNRLRQYEFATPETATLLQEALRPCVLPCAVDQEENGFSERMWRAQVQHYVSQSKSTERRQEVRAADLQRRLKTWRVVPVSVRAMDRKNQQRAPSFLTEGAITQPSPLPSLEDPALGLRLILLWERISAFLLMNFQEPRLIGAGRSYVWVEFMDCIAWVALPHHSRLAIGTRDRDGRWQLTDFEFDVFRPLDTAFWIEQVLLPWLPWLSLCSEADAEIGYDWLKHNLILRFHDPAWLKRVQRQLRAHLNVAPELNKAAIFLLRRQRQLAMSNHEYVRLWKAEPFWSDLVLRQPNLAHYCYAARKDGFDTSGHHVGVLKSLWQAMGMSPVGWRFLCRHGAGSYGAVIRDFAEDSMRACAIAAYVDWQSQVGLETPLPYRLGRTVASCAIEITESDKQLTILLDPRIARVGSEHWGRLECEAEREIFVTEQWTRVLMWLRDYQPDFDRNQWRVGWPAIWRSYEKWARLCADHSQWVSELQEFEVDEWTVTPLCSAYQLALEGMQMRHCVADYSERCVQDEYRVFAVQRSDCGEAMATVGLEKVEGQWKLDQVKGKCNSDPGPTLTALASEVLVRYQSAASRATPRKPIAPPVRTHKRHRVTHCYSCKEPLDNQIDPTCDSCGWIQCACGSCGCGWTRWW
jgi:hypothetical protein